MVKYGIYYISAKSGPIANISIELQASNVTNGFDLDHNLDLWILKVKCDLGLWRHTWHWPWIFMVKIWNSCISEWEGRLTLHKGGGSRSFMTMAMTIWWPRSGVCIYQIVTGMTSVVGVLSTHLVLDDTSLCCPITHVDCAMQQGHSVNWDRSVSTLRMLHRMQYSIAFWKCPEYRCLASKVLVWSLTVVSYNPINNSWTMEVIQVWWLHWAMQQDTTKPHLKH